MANINLAIFVDTIYQYTLSHEIFDIFDMGVYFESSHLRVEIGYDKDSMEKKEVPYERIESTEDPKNLAESVVDKICEELGL